MPRGHAVFGATSPKDPDWNGDPEGALRRIGEKNNAEYIEGSLTFAANGKIGHALFRTVEPEEGSAATNFVTLAEDLDAIKLSIAVDVDRWKANQEAMG